jgi:MazG family protein
VSAIDAGDDANMEEELGDLYLLVTMLSWMKEQEGTFSVASVLERISDKLVRRHPHVFGESDARTVGQILTQWDAIKDREKASHDDRPSSALDRIPGSLPPLERAAKVQKKAAKVGFDWPGPEPVWEKIEEELGELREAVGQGVKERIAEEVGDLLFSVVNLSRLLGIDPAVALHGTNAKFERRFRAIEAMLAAEGSRPADVGLQRMDELWEKVKAEE